MAYIVYKVTNLENNKQYIGITTTSLENRKSEHYKEARYCYNKNKNNTVFHKALLKYPANSFQWEIEDNTACNRKELFDKEQYYIQKYNTQINGYNMTEGGENPPKIYGEKNVQARLSDFDAIKIKELIKNTDITFKEIADSFNVASSTIERINAGTVRYDENETYPLRPKGAIYNKYKQRAMLIQQDLKNTTLTYKEISTKYNINSSDISRINTGTKYSELYNGTFPIRHN